MIDRDRLVALAAEYGAALTPAQAEQCDRYAALLVEWNRKMNLTGITDPEGMLIKHFVDSLTAAPFLPSGPFSLIDVGTGAGFPGVPLAILRPDCTLTLLDSLQKRLTFLEAVCTALNLPARRIHARAEDAARRPELREHFDIAVARAVAPLNVLCEYLLPFVRVGGHMLALKGPSLDAELSDAAFALDTLGARLERVENAEIPGRDWSHRLAYLEKTAPTPEKYPRKAGVPEKKPLIMAKK